MKPALFLIVPMAIFLTISCQPDTEAEKEAVMNILRQEADALIAGDFDSFKELHLQDELESRIEMGIYGYNVFKGWDKVSELIKDFLSTPHKENYKNKKENCIIKVSRNSAWVTCDNIWYSNSNPDEILYNNLQIVFLEKVKGDWKISLSAYYSKGDENLMTIH